MSFQHYDRLGGAYQMTPHQVSALARKHSLTTRKIYGRMAVECDGWNKLMTELGVDLAPGYTLVKQPQRTEEATFGR